MEVIKAKEAQWDLRHAAELEEKTLIPASLNPAAGFCHKKKKLKPASQNVSERRWKPTRLETENRVFVIRAMKLNSGVRGDESEVKRSSDANKPGGQNAEETRVGGQK